MTQYDSIVRCSFRAERVAHQTYAILAFSGGAHIDLHVCVTGRRDAPHLGHIHWGTMYAPPADPRTRI